MIDAIAEKTGLQKIDIDDVLDALADIATDVLSGGGRWRFFGFGSFASAVRPAHKGRNPRTGAAIAIAARTIVKFRPSQTLRDKLDRTLPAQPARREA
jgi:nucleoid DNA-binding protein